MPSTTTHRRIRIAMWWVGGSVLSLAFLVLIGVVTWTVATAGMRGGPDRTSGTATAPVLLSDRGAETTIAALRALDACRLVDPVALSPGDPEPPAAERHGPHECAVGGAGGRVDVTVGVAFPEKARWHAEPILVGGVRAYRNRPAVSDRSDGYCEVQIPVSFHYTVEFRLRTADGPDVCPAAERVAAAAVPLLRDPPPPPPPDQAPLAGVDPCAVLVAAGRFDPATVRLDDGAFGGVDKCEMRPSGDALKSVTLELVYGELPDQGGCDRDVVVPGTRVHTEFGTRSVAVLRIHDDDCARAAGLADRSLAALPAATAAPPTRPVRLFAPDESDIAKTGPCVDQVEECMLPGDVDVPDGVDGLLAAADGDRSYACRAAEDPVRRVYGPSMRATLYGDFCHFMDERHEVDIAVAVTGSFDPREYGNQREFYEVSQDDVVEGHEARFRESAVLGVREYHWIVRPRPGPPGAEDERAGRGVVQVSVSHWPPRGIELGPDAVPHDQAARDRGRALVADLLRTRFSG